jgi:hypothetical protein
MNDRRDAAKRLQEKYSRLVAERGGDLEVNARGHFLSAAITWRHPNSYEHIDIQLEERLGFRKWRPIRSVVEAADLVEAQIQDWLRDGPPETL